MSNDQYRWKRHGRQRTAAVHARCFPEELEQVRALAARHDLGTTEWIMMRCLTTTSAEEELKEEPK